MDSGLGKTIRDFFGVATPPTADSLGALFDKVDNLSQHLKQVATSLNTTYIAPLQEIENNIQKVRGSLGLKGNEKPDQNLTANHKAECEKAEAALAGISAELRSLNGNELKRGRDYFLAFLVLFLLAFGGYAYTARGRRHLVEVTPTMVVDTTKQLRAVELEVGKLAGSRAPDGTVSADLHTRAVEAVVNFRKSAEGLDFSVPLLQLVGSLQAEVDQDQATATETCTKLSPMVVSELEGLRTSYLNEGRRWVWIQVVWWAELGALVGILFYIAGALSAGTFSSAESAMFWAEATIAPIVILAVFFLFNLTGITDISPQSSVMEKLGLAFILGFAMRRTLGLLDNIKKRILPKPEPTS